MDAQATFSYAFTQSDVGGPAAQPPSVAHWAAQRLLPQDRRNLAIQSARWCSTGLRPWPGSDEVSRKFLYQQAHTAEEALQRSLRTLEPIR